MLAGLFFWDRDPAPVAADQITERASAPAPSEPAAKEAEEPREEPSFDLGREAQPERITGNEESHDYSQYSETELSHKFDAILKSDEPNFDDLRTIAKQYAQLKPNDPAAYKMLALAEISSDNMNSNDAISAIERGLALSPQDPELREQWFSVKALDQTFDFQKYSEENPNDMLGQYYAAVDKWNKGDKEGAQEGFNHVAENAPEGSSEKELADTALIGDVDPPFADSGSLDPPSEPVQN